VTVIVEVPIYVWLGRIWLGRRTLGASRRDRSDLAIYGGVNLLSHPALWFMLAPAGARVLGATAGILAAEGLVTVGEGVAVAHATHLRRTSALALAALANAASFGIGLTLAGL
jgi:hypothetical protein